MGSMVYLSNGFDVTGIVSSIARHPELWNEHTARTQDDFSPHSSLDDIWLRYNDFDNYNDDRESFNNEHDSVWYPSSDLIPVKQIVMQVMAMVGGERLGGVLITRIPPGGKCAPHVDGGWHAGYYEKFAIQLEGTLDQAFHFEGESFSALPGDLYTFDNSKLHWVENNSDANRMTMIICIKRSL